jgi:hypothetical protein
MMRELGFQRRGKNVVAQLTIAITQSASNAPGRHGLPRRLQFDARLCLWLAGWVDVVDVMPHLQ